MSMSPTELLPSVYAELRRLAAVQMRHERDDHTLDATALVNEAWLKLNGESFTNRSEFLRVAAEAMRHILIDHARQRAALKRGGGRTRVSLSEVELADRILPDELLSLNDALERFAIVEPLKAELVKLRYFVGLTEDEAAAALGISRSTSSRYWTYARAWLSDAMEKSSEG